MVQYKDCSPEGLFDDAKLLEHLLQCRYGTVHLFVGVVGHKCHAHQRIGGMAGRRNDGIDEDTGLESHGRGRKGLLNVAYIEGDDGALGVADFKTFLLEALEGIACHLPQAFDALGLALEDMKGLECRCCGSRRTAGTEDVGAASVTEEVDDGSIGSDESADGGQTLGEGAHDEVHVGRTTEMVAHTAAVAAEDTDAVCLVNHKDGIGILLLQGDDFGQGSQVAFHGEDAVHDDEFHGILLATLEFELQVGHIVVLVAKLLGHRQPAAVDDGSMVAVVADDVVVRTEEGGDDTAVDRKASGDAEGIVLSHEFRQLALKLDMDVERTVEEAASSASAAIFAHGFHSGLDDAVVTSKGGIGIAAKHDDVMPGHVHFGTLLALYGTEIRVQTFGTHLGRLGIFRNLFV